ncbi:unnamed protein product [Agarophyton chilense]
MRHDIDGTTTGVGIELGAEQTAARWWRRGVRHLVVQHVVRASPAARAGLRLGDRITAIDLRPTARMHEAEARARLAGEPGRTVMLCFHRAGVHACVQLRRSRRVRSVSVWARRIVVRDVGDVAYVRVREFSRYTARDAAVALRALRPRPEEHDAHVALCVLDLRANGGGLVERAVQLAAMFVPPRRVLVRFAARDGKQWAERGGARHIMRATPVLVLVDGATASAAELVTAALRDNCRAVVLGARTYGKASVQAIVPLSEGAGAIAVTVARYATPRGEPVAGCGLQPDRVCAHLPPGERAVHRLFARGAQRRMRWIHHRLRMCAAAGDFGEEVATVSSNKND